MAEFFLELFSEEIPSRLQKNFREELLEEFQKIFLKKSIKSKKSFSLSTPNRLIIVFEGLDKEVKISTEEIKGPKVGAPELALEGFVKSNKIEQKDRILISQNIEDIKVNYSESCRIYIRPSGTEPLIRVLVEAENEKQVNSLSREITNKLSLKINNILNSK